MRQTAFFAAALTVLAGSLSAADQQMMNLLMPDAKIVAGINVDQAKSSQFGQFVLGHMGSDQHLQGFIEMSGFDPRTDLHEVLFATGVGGGGHDGLLLARGNFSLDKISALAAKTGGKKVATYKGVPLLGSQGENGQYVIAVVDNTLVIAGDLASVQAALDRRAAASSIDPALAARVHTLSTTQDAWTVSIAPLSAFSKMPIGDPTLQGAFQGDLLKKVQQTSGGIRFGETVSITGEALATSNQDASALGDVVKFLAGMIQVNAQDLPVTSLVRNLNVTSSGNTLKLNLSIKEDQLEAFLNSANQDVHVKHKPSSI
ncbi:MAG: hypothetical protein M3Z85_03190 [Acidobacteriota bacterium]|nr:hypothetical protein [Acidobacteriota bacterium]